MDWNFEDGSYSFCDLGTGDVPWEETMSALQAIGYDGTVVAVMLPYSPGLLERTSVALDSILQANGSPPAVKSSHRIDRAMVEAPSAQDSQANDESIAKSRT